MGLRRLLLAGLVMLGLTADAARADGPLAPESPLAGSFAAPGHHAAYPLDTALGEYVEGVLDSGATPVDLHLTSADGRPVRLLLAASAGRASFRFVAEGGPMALRVTAGAPGSFTLTLTRRIGRDDQIPAPRLFDSAAIAALAQALERGDTTDAFWREAERAGTPLIEPRGGGMVVMTFLARGARRNVRLLGGPSSDHESLERLGRSDVWFKSFVVPAATRLSYQIAPDVPDFPGTCRECREAILAQTQVDPLNKRPWPPDAPDRYNQQSLVDLPDAPPQPGLDDWEGAGDAPAGTLTTARFASRRLGNTRDVAVHTPAGFDPADPDNVLLLLFDGAEYRTRVPTPLLLDRLTAQGRLPPVVAVFVANPDAAARARELPDNPAFAAMLADELLPWIAARTGLTPHPARTVLAGSSYGGLAAVTAALARPERFGNALSISGSFWWHPDTAPPDRPEHVAALVAARERLPVRVFLAAGLFETGQDGDLGILETNRHLRDVMEIKGYDVIHREYAAGHDYHAWRGALGDGLLALFRRV